MEKQGRRSEPQGKTKSTNWTGWIPALWSIEAIVIGGGLALGGLVFTLLAKPAFNASQDMEGYVFVVMAVICPLIPSIGAAHIHGIHRKLGLPGKRRDENAVS